MTKFSSSSSCKDDEVRFILASGLAMSVALSKILRFDSLRSSGISFGATSGADSVCGLAGSSGSFNTTA